MKKMVCMCKQCGANSNALLDNDPALVATIDKWVVHQSGQDVIQLKHLREMSPNPPNSPLYDCAQVFGVFFVIGIFLMTMPGVVNMLSSMAPNTGASPSLEVLQNQMMSILPYFCGVGVVFCVLRCFYSVYSNMRYEQEYNYIMAKREIISKLKEKAKSFGVCTYCKSLFATGDESGYKEELNPVNLRSIFQSE